MLVEGDLADALESFRAPLAYFDFETVMPAIPVWDGCGPYTQVPVQFSCHVEAEDGTLTHHEWVPEGPGDPRAEIAARAWSRPAEARRASSPQRVVRAARARASAEAVPFRAPGAARRDRARGGPVARARPRVPPGLRRQLLDQVRLQPARARARVLIYEGSPEVAKGDDAANVLAELLFGSGTCCRSNARRSARRYSSTASSTRWRW